MGTDSFHQLANVRDVGGLSTARGARIRHGVLLRSDAPVVGDAAPDGITWPPSVVLDLRTESDLEPEHPLAQKVTQVVWVPMTPEADPRRMLSDAGSLNLSDLYQKILDSLGGNMKAIVEVILSAQGATLVHCVAGKDRTGVLIAVLLAAVGVSRSQIEADYHITAHNMAAVMERVVLALPEAKRAKFRAKLAKAPVGLFDTPSEGISAVLDNLEAHPGGPGAWLTDHGVSRQQLARLRLHLTD